MTESQKKTIRTLAAAGKSQRAIAETVGCSRATVRRVLNGVVIADVDVAEPPAEQVKTYLRSENPRTLADMVEACGIDLEAWEVISYEVNKWEVGSKVEKLGLVKGEPIGVRVTDGIITEPLFQIKVKLKPRKAGAWTPEQFCEKLAGQIKALSFDANVDEALLHYAIQMPTGKHLLEVDPFDVHFGKYCWGEETVSDFDLQTAARLFRYAIEDLIQKSSGFGVERVLFVVGNDALHVDGPRGQTFGGTQMDVDTRFAKVFMRAHELHSWAIRRLLQRAPVDIMVVPGNHDTTAAWHLGHVLKTEFSNDPNVTVQNTTRPRKYYAYGNTLLGFAHGDRGKEADLPLLMAREEPKLWAAAQFREFHIGHKHKYSETKWRASESYAGVIVRTLNAITAHDLWHTAEGYIDRRAMQAFIHHRTTGLAAMLHANVLHDGNIPT